MDFFQSLQGMIHKYTFNNIDDCISNCKPLNDMLLTWIIIKQYEKFRKLEE